MASEAKERAGRAVALIGLGHIGSRAAGGLTRLKRIERVALVDFDRYEARNLGGQEIEPEDVGRLKVEAQADRLRRIRGDWEIDAIAMPVERVPVGRLRADAILACVDSWEARRTINRIAGGLGVAAWIDSGVDAARSLARANVYIPGARTPCLECGWSEEVYASLERRHSCPGEVRSAPTDAPPELGAAAAAMQIEELEKILAGDWERVASSRERIRDLRRGRLEEIALRRKTACRFDHAPWPAPRRLAVGLDRIAIGDLLSLGAGSNGASARLFVQGQSFVRESICPACGLAREALAILGRDAGDPPKCSACGGALEPLGYEIRDWIESDELDGRALERSAASIGVAAGDIAVIERGGSVERIEFAAA
jgi:molybdopterin/thiamine biosynthesis adenylyltransferase